MTLCQTETLAKFSGPPSEDKGVLRRLCEKCGLERVQPGQVLFQDLPAQKQHRRKCEILRTGGNIQIRRQMRQESLHLGRAHLTGVALAMKQDEEFNPVQVGFFRAQAVVQRRMRSRTCSSKRGDFFDVSAMALYFAEVICA